MSQAEQGGQIGVTLLAFWYEPVTRKLEDVEAAARMIDFTVGWFILLKLLKCWTNKFTLNFMTHELIYGLGSCILCCTDTIRRL
jgi:hypothetical protein